MWSPILLKQNDPLYNLYYNTEEYFENLESQSESMETEQQKVIRLLQEINNKLSVLVRIQMSERNYKNDKCFEL